MQKPLNNDIRKAKKIKRIFNKIDNSNPKTKDNNPYVSIIVSTMRNNAIDNVFQNFERQLYKNKEMIIVLNNNDMDKDLWKSKAKKYKNVKVYMLDESNSLGKCLNFAVSKSKYDIVAKFDDDDYYGPKYLSDSIKALKYADVIGKAASFVYFKKDKILGLRSPLKENKYVKHMDGPTLIIKKHVFNKVKFADIHRGVDTQFSKDCMKNRIRIYSTNRFHHVYIRSESSDNHTWKIKNEDLLKRCRKIEIGIEDFTPYVDI